MPEALALRGWLEQERPAMVELLERLAAAESPTLEPESQRPALALLAAELERSGLVARPVRGVAVGDHLYARPSRRGRGAPYQLLLGHVDTVWPRGTLAQMPVRQEDGLLCGPGTIDMKGGLVVLVYALRALAALGLEPAAAPVVFVNTDEEIGSPDSSRWLRLLAAGAARAFVLEAAEGPAGRLKIARKGVGRFTVVVHGRAAHAGTSFEQGVSAILELSNQVQRLFALNDRASGITVNVGMIDGGLRANVVAPQASAVVGVRAPTAESARRLEAAIRALEPTLPGAQVEISGGFDGRPPMEPTARNRALLGDAIRLGHKLGLYLEDAGLVGGGSDANTTSLYTATLDGLGPRGDGSHAADEHVVIASLPERAALLALLLLQPLDAPPRRIRQRRRSTRRLAVVGSAANETNGVLVAAWNRLGIETELVAAAAVRRHDLVLARLDVLPTLDGVEPGLLQLLLLERRGVRVLNPAAAILRAHDKLLTARTLTHASLPHPTTVQLLPGGRPRLAPPLVLKPRFGSWGADVYRCDTLAELRRCIESIRERAWFRRHGAILQQLVPPRGHDLRLLVAGGLVVGAAERIAAPGEWRTNISLGGQRRPADPPPRARHLAIAAASALGIDFVGVDLLPHDNDYTILELNAAVEFDETYAPDRDIYRQAAEALELPGTSPARTAQTPETTIAART